MSEQTCATCEHWKPPAGRTDYKNIWKEIAADTQYGQCTLIQLGDTYEPAPDPLPLAVTKDGSDYKADLYTQAEFGCVLWEQVGEPGTQRWMLAEVERKKEHEAALAASREKWRDNHPLTTDPDGTTRSRP